MIKGLLNVFILVGLLIQNHSFALPVRAEETKEPTIKINGIYQGDTLATIDKDGNYIIDKYDKIYLDYEIENTNGKNSYIVDIKSNESGSAFRYLKGYKEKLYLYNILNYNSDIITYDIKIYDTWERNKLYDSKTFNLKIDYYNEIKNSSVILSNITQNNNKVKDEETYYGSKTIYANDKQNILFKLTGENLIEDANYTIYYGNYSQRTFKGSDINKGIPFENYTNIDKMNSIRISLNDIGINIPVKYYDETKTYDNYTISYYNDESLPNYDSYLFYTNYKDIEIKKTQIEPENRDYYIISSKYYNKNNTLSVNITGNNYEDKDYDVKVDVRKNNVSYYIKALNINGLLLNNGYNIELDDLPLELTTDILTSGLYEFDIEVNKVVTKTEYKYISLENDVSMTSNIFFENGKKNLSVFRGDGNYFFGSGIYDTNKDVFEKYSSIYLRYIGEDFNSNDTYEYILEYGNFEEEYDFDERQYEVVLKQGEIKGSLLNTVGLLFKVNNYKNYNNPTYKLTIKKGSEVLYVDAPVLYIVKSPTLANASLSANNKSLYLQTSDLSYIATRNSKLDIAISGLGFEDDTTYEFTYGYTLEHYDESTKSKTNIIKFKGKDLNNGTAKLNFDEKIDDTVKSVSIYVFCDLENTYNENVTIQGGFTITFVDSKDYFPTLTKYVVDNINDLIKNISKNTSVTDFTNNLDVKDNGKVKIFDVTGTTEVKGNIGTGMIARIVNKYDENILDLDVVVKGDVSGDGNISITDLVKVKRHLSGNDSLTGVYKVAGDISNTGNISITDLVKISRDVAKIQEVE